MFEGDLHHVTHLVAQWQGHPDALDPELVRSGFRIAFPPLRYLDTPGNRLRHAILGSKFGVDDQVDYLLREHPDIDTEEEAIEYLRKLAERRAELDEFRASRQQPGDPTAVEDANFPGEGLAEAQGRAGGEARALGELGTQGPRTSPSIE